MYKIAEIEIDRKRKLETLLLGHLDSVKKEFFTKIATLTPHIDLAQVKSALEFAEAQDYGQGEYTRFYITHPIRMAGFCCDWMNEHQEYSTDFIVAALIHNVFEKDVLEKEECREQFGDWVFRAVDTITPDREELKTAAGTAAYYGRISQLSSMGQMLKFFDKFDNIYALCLNPDEITRTSYLKEIVDYLRPIALKFHPSILPYFDALVENTKKLGHYKPKLGT